MSESSQFKIRIVAGLSASLGFGVEGMMMDIWDTTNNRLCVYDLRGVSIGAGTPIAVSFRGPWNSFETLQPMGCDQFGGLARFATVFVMDQSLNAFLMEPFGKYPVEVAPFRTGWSLGFGAATGGGVFARMFPAINASDAIWPHNVDSD